MYLTVDRDFNAIKKSVRTVAVILEILSRHLFETGLDSRQVYLCSTFHTQRKFKVLYIMQTNRKTA